MKITELLAQREQELITEIEEMEKVEVVLNECRHELEVLRKAQGVVLDETPLLEASKAPDETPKAESKTNADVADSSCLRKTEC